MTSRSMMGLEILAAIVAVMLAMLLRPANGSTPFVMTNLRGHPGLSVMTYNIEGLPWPVRFGRDAAFLQISARLRALRMAGEQPHIVVLQEAFTDDAKRIGGDAGYRAPAIAPRDRDFQLGARLLSGERSGKLVDSGLEILSDYPILSVRRMAFPRYACAGFDCLANKGAVLATIAVPGMDMPLAVVDVHLNSRRASRVADDRSLYAYQRQIDALDQFLATSLKAGTPLILAGDFNVGNRPSRLAYFTAHMRKWSADTPGGVKDALRTCFAQTGTCGATLPADAAFSMRRARDWQLSFPGTSTALAVDGLAAPFGHDIDGAMLSDHVGYVAYYAATPSLKRRLAGAV